MISDYQIYLNPVDDTNFSFNKSQLGYGVNIYSKKKSFPDLIGIDIAIIGVPEERGSKNNLGSSISPDIIREQLYSLYNHHDHLKIVDVGNIKSGKELTDTYFALQEIVRYFISNKILVIILGGSNDLVFGNYLAYEKLNKLVNITCIDSRFDIGENETEHTSDSYIGKIIMHKPNYLFNYTNIGYQSYYNDYNIVKSMDSLYFDMFRLGVARSNLVDIEPAIRNSDIISFDISSIKRSDAPGNLLNGPNGFTGDEFCTLARYAGISDRVSSIGFYEYNSLLDINFQTAELIAQAIWYVIDGYSCRIEENPLKDLVNFTKYHVNSNIFENGLIFYKSNITNRWWMEVECPDDLKEKYATSYLVSCSYNDYLEACSDKVPQRWMQVLKKLL
ncbi:formimidoylglutamase [Odoribacter sp. OttesenSCG-928-L07]|nr:formimidoylglutamase [Odoribacter sp. OttesenSCG-928-L07]MDL2241265.1 formimidoylglutamase [Bacteroidales bacterium OttesenSCG-928-K22]